MYQKGLLKSQDETKSKPILSISSKFRNFKSLHKRHQLLVFKSQNRYENPHNEKGLYSIQVADIVKTTKEDNLLLSFQEAFFTTTPERARSVEDFYFTNSNTNNKWRTFHFDSQIYIQKDGGLWLQFEAESFRIDQSDTSMQFLETDDSYVIIVKQDI